ncbi:putative nucleotidyltransferase-like protein [Sphingomonas sp. PP-F2F-G114-C0414]|uniref:nucleotidyltransferase domain-containing protein n=1 Tax=Sphingomonas sp. PP-F2F-G114-C0414 TaxID=2135662 RepID=UPI000EF8B209|nr:nucleotidyltransferase family protein [Sphingomonas sp. PP-F2F-G114-C0414]RMB25716.1 putative nucleotidyltransferase-like protein [Sphingomonas sp. PP-F2F-G114-C0414]
MASPEFAFVCACAGPLAPPDTDGDLDGATLAAIAHRHQVVPLVVEALKRHGRPISPALAARHDPLAPLRAAREAIRLRTLLLADGIEPIFLKGSALAMLAYGALARRQFSDIDLLVRPADARRAAALLENAGYRARSDTGGNPADTNLAGATLANRVARLSPLAKDMEVRHVDNGQIVELHWRMTDALHERPAQDREAVQWVELAPGAAVPTLATDALFAYICNHGAAHMWARLRWLADVAALLAREPDGGDRLWHAAVARRQGRAAASAILLARRYFGTPVPPAFAAPVSLRLRLLVALSRRVIEAGGGTTELARTHWRGWAEMTGKLLVVSSPGDLGGWCVRLLFSASDAEAERSRFWFVLHPLQRIPKLLKRRRLRQDLRRTRERA